MFDIYMYVKWSGFILFALMIICKCSFWMFVIRSYASTIYIRIHFITYACRSSWHMIAYTFWILFSNMICTIFILINIFYEYTSFCARSILFYVRFRLCYQIHIFIQTYTLCVIRDNTSACMIDWQYNVELCSTYNYMQSTRIYHYILQFHIQTITCMVIALVFLNISLYLHHVCILSFSVICIKFANLFSFLYAIYVRYDMHIMFIVISILCSLWYASFVR